jgi:hypothetical protein
LQRLFRVKDKFDESFKKCGVTWRTLIGIVLLSKINGIKTITRKNSYDYQSLPQERETEPKSPLERDKEKTFLDIRGNVTNDFDDMKVAAAYDDILEWYDGINEVGDDVLNEFISKKKVNR